MTRDVRLEPSKYKVLFFGRKGCAGTQLAHSFLKTLGCQVELVESGKKGEELPAAAQSWSGDFIFCFRSYFILKKDLLDRAKVAAINFHPAPPEYPGSGCINFALYEGADEYGVTAHIMNEKVDNGTILRCIRFPILKQETLPTLLERTHFKLAQLFLDFTTDLFESAATGFEALNNIPQDEHWAGQARKIKELNHLQEVQTDISEKELHRRIRAFHLPPFPLYTILQGKRFILNNGT